MRKRVYTVEWVPLIGWRAVRIQKYHVKPRWTAKTRAAAKIEAKARQIESLSRCT